MLVMAFSEQGKISMACNQTHFTGSAILLFSRLTPCTATADKLMLSAAHQYQSRLACLRMTSSFALQYNSPNHTPALQVRMITCLPEACSSKNFSTLVDSILFLPEIFQSLMEIDFSPVRSLIHSFHHSPVVASSSLILAILFGSLAPTKARVTGSSASWIKRLPGG